MKKHILLPAIILSLFLVFAGGTQSLPADEDDHFQLHPDGTVRVDGLVFDSLPEYFQSEYFRNSDKRCGTDMRPENRRGFDEIQASTSHCTTSRTTIQNEYYPSQTLTVRVVFHVIYKSDGTGNISDQRIADQMEVMNEDYGAIAGSLGENGYNTKIQFVLSGTDRTQNDAWFTDSNADELAYKTALAWDQDTYLNIYTNDAGGYLGYAYFPQTSAGGVKDGIVMLHSVVGGRDLAGAGNYDQGRTLVHEAGHYFGLYHTFEGCANTYTGGDLIVDTNGENTAHYGCTQTNTCGSPDPIHNYMNYTDDTCMWKFTQEQANRMVCGLMNYRPGVYTTGGSSPTLTLTSPNGGETLTPGGAHTITWSYTGTVGNVRLQYSTNAGSSWTSITSSTANDGSHSWTVPNVSSTQCYVKIAEASDGVPSDTSNAAFTIGAGGTPTLSLNHSRFDFTAAGGVYTASQQLLVNNSGSGTLSWTASSDASWLLVSPSDGSGAGILTVSINPAGLGQGSYSGSVVITDSGATNSPQAAMVYLDVIPGSQDYPPFGEFATPADGANVSSSIAVTGWVLDDVEVADVKLYNSGAYIGDAVLIDGARPDVETAYPGYPSNYQAGWGYMMLTNFLPGGGNGTYTISAVATDNAGQSTTLGSKTITVDNYNAVKPFGAIDTPSMGGSAMGTFRNIGWALTPMPNEIPTDGSTIKVYVDGASLGTANYNLYRSDIAALFPGYANSNGALGYLDFDTTGYDNGVHTIVWSVTDDAGNSDGIGSRYFNIENVGNRSAQGSAAGELTHVAALAAIPAKKDAVSVKTEVLERIVLKLDDHSTPNTQHSTPRFKGYMVVGERLKRLPVGSTLDAKTGKFYWIPTAGFHGTYDLVFIDTKDNTQQRVKVKVK